MDIQEVIYGRRSIRKYKDQPISDEDIRDILEAGMMAPSAENYQPWYFVVVKSKETMKDVTNIMAEASRRVTPGLVERFRNHPSVADETSKFIRMLGGAPVCIMAFILKPEYGKKESTMIQSVSAAIENMLLAACAKGIGSCWMTAPIESGVDEMLKETYAPDKGNMIAMITFGYPAIEAKMPKRKEGRFEII